MSLLGEVAVFTHDIVATVMYRANQRSLAIISMNDFHDITYGHRVGTAYTFDAEIALYLRIEKLPTVRADYVPASRIAYDCTRHHSSIRQS